MPAPPLHPSTHTSLLHIPLRRLSYQTDGCTFEEESEETFNEQEAGWGAFWIISWSISTPQRKWHCEGLWSDKQHLFRRRTEEGADTRGEISGVFFSGLVRTIGQESKPWKRGLRRVGGATGKKMSNFKDCFHLHCCWLKNKMFSELEKPEQRFFGQSGEFSVRKQKSQNPHMMNLAKYPEDFQSDVLRAVPMLGGVWPFSIKVKKIRMWRSLVCWILIPRSSELDWWAIDFRCQ